MSKPKSILLAGFAVFAALTGTGCAADSNANIALRQSAQASVSASSGAAHALAASGQAALAVSSVPLAAGGAVLGGLSAVSGGAVKASMRAASAPAGAGLPVTEQTITVIPPDKALKQ